MSKNKLSYWKNHPGSAILRLLVWLSAIITVAVMAFLVGFILIKGVGNLTPDLFALEYNSDNASLMPALINTLIITLLGISSGAKLAVALVMVAFLNQGLLTSSLTLITAAFAGAMASMAFVLAVSRRVQRMSILVICGVMIGYICSAVTEFVVAFAQDSNIVNLHNWSQGSFSGMTWGNVRAAALVVLPALAAAFAFMSNLKQ